MAVIFDLFDKPRSDREGLRGRPEHVPTPENVRKVRALVLAGWTRVAIAGELGISAPTLSKVYFRQLEKAREEVRLNLRARMILQLEAEAEKGNVSAIKALWHIVEQDGLKSLPAAPRKLKPMGKKEAKKAAALQPTGGWADLVPGPTKPQ